MSILDQKHAIDTWTPIESRFVELHKMFQELKEKHSETVRQLTNVQDQADTERTKLTKAEERISKLEGASGLASAKAEPKGMLDLRRKSKKKNHQREDKFL